MTGQLLWTVNPRATCLHAADAVRRGLPLTEPLLAETLAAPVKRLEELLTAEGVGADLFFSAAIPLSVGSGTSTDLAEASLRLVCPTNESPAGLLERLSAVIGRMEQAVWAIWPRLDENVRLRERPLREQWEARGPGLLRYMARLTEGAINVPDATVALVQPCLGGGGSAHSAFGIVCFEAVLANPWGTLPEPVRLGWLLAQLPLTEHEPDPAALALPLAIGRQMSWALATLALALEAAEHVEWTRCDRETLRQALEQWRAPLPAGWDQGTLADLLDQWRQDWRTGNLEWSAAWRELAEQIA